MMQPMIMYTPNLNPIHMSHGGRIKILVVLRHPEGSGEFKKMMVVMNSGDKIYSLKRAIEKEFMELFPMEQPYVVAKVEDNNGYSLSNQSNVEDFITNGMTVYALPESLLDPSEQNAKYDNVHLHAGQNITELVHMLNSLQHNILKKLATSSELNRCS